MMVQFILAEAQDFTENIDIISTTEEKFMCFEFCKLIFKDTFKFLTMSLESLVEIMIKKIYCLQKNIMKISLSLRCVKECILMSGLMI
jgi:hypothetical protein